MKAGKARGYYVLDGGVQIKIVNKQSTEYKQSMYGCAKQM
jgi:hypothetical protein